MTNKIIQEAIDRFKQAEEREDDNRKRAEKAIEFQALKQWPDKIKNLREDPYQEGGAQPCPVLDKTNQYVRQVVNEERMNTPRLKFRPVDDFADPEVAEVYDGLARHIQDRSNAVYAYTTAGEHAASGGFGYFRMLTDYCDPESFDQDISIKRIHNRFSVLFGPHTESTASDAKYVFVFEDLTHDDFKATYPGKLPSNLDTAKKDNSEWFGEDSVRITEYIKIVESKIKIVLLSTGESMHKDEYDKQTKAAQAAGILDIPQIVKERDSLHKQVKWYKMTGTDILEEKDLLGTMLPVFQVVGEELTMPDGKIRRSGMIEQAMDPQRLHNYAHACFIENVALAPRAPFIGPKGFMAGSEKIWRMANHKNVVGLEYTPVNDDEGRPLPAPQRTQMPGVPAGWQQMLMNTEHGIEAAFGMYGPSVGGPSRERSGVALEEQKSQGQVGNLHYPDNLSRAILQCGRVMLEWIPYIYDTERVSRILGEDDSVDTAYLNPEQEEAVMERKDGLGQALGKSYNLNVGKYDVTVSTGPAYQTKRQEAAAQMTDVLKSKPELMQVIGDLVFRNLDWPGADEIADRLKAMLPPQIQQMESKDNKSDPRIQAMMAQIEQAGKQIEEKAQALGQAEQQIKVMEDKLKAESTRLDAERQVFDAQKEVALSQIKEQMTRLEMQQLKMENAMLKQPQPTHEPQGPM